jgi:hypothetical protein
VIEHVIEFPYGDLAHEALRRARDEDFELILLPDEISEGSEPVAAFRESAQALRVDLERAGMKVLLAKPSDASAAVFREHDAATVLVIVLAIPGAIASLIQVAEWIRRHSSAAPPSAELRYRQVELLPDGTFVMREIQGPPEAVADAIVQRARGELPPPTEA